MESTKAQTLHQNFNSTFHFNFLPFSSKILATAGKRVPSLEYCHLATSYWPAAGWTGWVLVDEALPCQPHTPQFHQISPWPHMPCPSVNVWMCVCVCVCVCECVCEWASECVSEWVNVCVCVSEWVCEWMNVCVSEWVSEWVSVYMCARVSVSVSEWCEYGCE